MMVPEGSGLEWLVSEAPQPPPEPQPRGVGLLPSLVQPGPSGEATIARMQRAYSTGDLSMLAHQQTTSVHRLGGLVDSPLFEEALAAIPVPEGAPLRNDGAIAMGRGGGADGGAQTAQQPEMGGMLGAGFGLGVAGASGVRSLGGAVPSSSGSSELLGWAQSLNFDDDYARMGQALAGGALTMPSAPLQPTSRGALGGSLMRKSMSTGDLASWGRTAAEGHPSSSLGPRRIGAYTIEERQVRAVAPPRRQSTRARRCRLPGRV